MKVRIRHSFRNQIFVTVLLVTLVPLLLCSVLMLSVQVSRVTRDQQRQAAEQLSAAEQALDDYLCDINAVLSDRRSSTALMSQR